MLQNFYETRDLVDRLCNASETNDRSVVFLVGSAISLPDHEGGHGVPGVSDIVEIIRREFDGGDAVVEFDKLVNEQSTNKYQKAFEFLHGRRGQDVANRIIRTAVWHAIDTNNWPSNLPNEKATPNDADPDICKALEKEVNAWILPRAVDLLGHLLVTYSDTFGGAVLTTNFDPLIEISLQKHGGQWYRTVLPDDGNLEQTVSSGTHVIHLHGYWSGYDTLHTFQQLGRPRPRLKRSLTRFVEGSTLVVVGYGGWDDVITQTLMEIVSDPMSTPEILWAFHENDVSRIEASHDTLLSSLAPGIHRSRVLLYRGVACCSLLSEISNQLEPNYPSRIGTATSPQITTVVKETSAGHIGRRHLRIAVDFTLPDQASAESDSPLIVEPWIGRDQELNILTTSNTSVAFITGLGGQGKSALAGRFLSLQCHGNNSRFEFWDWRDCKEESDRLNTQLLRLIERLSDGAIDTSKIESTDIKAVVNVLFRVLRDRTALLVFDNVDQYVDLETFRLIKGLDYLVGEAQARNHQCLFLFTCRLNVQLDESRSVRLPLEGLTADETAELVAARGIPKSDCHLAKELHKTTKGHPLWINLIVMQALRNSGGLCEAIRQVDRGSAEIPDTTRTIWGMLNHQQQDVLRTMAELDRPESESQLQRLLPGVTFNRIYRAIKTLRSNHLVEVRTQLKGEPLLGLHPIIREFVRTNFAKKEREKYVGTILEYLDHMIGQFKGLLSKEPSYQILEYWTRKAELQVTFGHFQDATSTIAEIAPSLIDRGYGEEFVRLTLRLFGECDWAIACSSYRHFDDVFQKCMNQLIVTGHDAIDELLTQYEEAIPGKSSQFILLCDLRCYADWYAGNYESAIRWGEKGNRLKESTSVDTVFSSKHNLALARRDGGYVSEAINMFLDGESLESVITPGKRIDGKDHAFFGNIGRCLFFDERFDDALTCYVKSAQLLQEGSSNRTNLNRGYIRLWIADLLNRRGESELAAACYRAAICIWDKTSPPRSLGVKEKLAILVREHPALVDYLEEADWKVEGIFSRWIDNQ